MSWYKTRMYVCDICGRRQEATNLEDGVLVAPAGWLHEGRRWGLTMCKDCRAAIAKGDGIIWLSAFNKKGGVVEE